MHQKNGTNYTNLTTVRPIEFYKDQSEAKTENKM